MTTILLIEDNDTIRENTAEILSLTGYRVLTAGNGKIGVELALQVRPDLIICDIMMPVLDGYGVLHIVNKNPQLTGIPFIFLTAKTDRTDVRRGMDLGADDYLTKPFDESELLNAIEGRLNRFRHIGTPEAASPAPAPTHQLEQLLTNRKGHTVARKQVIYAEGDTPTRLFVLKQGRLKTVRTHPDGKELITGLHYPGDFVGYVPLLSQTPYTDSAIALETCELLYVPADEFRALLQPGHSVEQQFMHLLTGRLNEQEQHLLGMAYGSLRRRVADTLLRLHDQHPHDPIQLSRDDLAALVGTATESLIRVLSEFRHDGLIEQNATGIRVVQPEAFRRANW